MEPDERPAPVDVDVLSAAAVVQVADALAQLVQKARSGGSPTASGGRNSPRRWLRSTTELDMRGLARWGENPRLPPRQTAGRVPGVGAGLRMNLILYKTPVNRRFLNADNSF
jgi:hypothetical protein